MSDEEQIKARAVSFFLKLYTLETRTHVVYPIIGKFLVISAANLESWDATITDVEIKEAVFSMQPSRCVLSNSMVQVGKSVCCLV